MLKLFYRLLVIAFAIAGLTLQFLHSENILATLSYYTVLSNLFVLLLFIFVVYYYNIAQHKETAFYSILKGGATVAILLTFIVYHFVLRPVLVSSESTYSPYSISDLLVHYIVPLMTFIDYALFDTKGQYKKTFIKFWMIFPFAYVLYVYLYGILGGRFPTFEEESVFPYFFLDYETYGYSVLLFISAIALFYLFLSASLYFIDQYIAKKKTN